MAKIDAKIDFNLSGLEQDNLQGFLNRKEQEIKTKLNQQRKQAKIINWVMLGVLTVSLVSLSALYFFQTKENNSRLAQARNRLQQIAGMIDDDPESSERVPAITGDSLAIRPEVLPPNEFIKFSNEVEFRFLNNKKAMETSFTAKMINNNQELKSGVKIQVVEYDKRYSSRTFADLILAELGDDFEIKSRSISIPKNFLLTKITSQEKEFYTGVTTDNYYLIEIFRETEGISKYQEINEFTDSILQNLYLN